ncbi:MAG: type II toxin-antitoxin system VapC family toxin [Geodermatophilaceae bacterium]|nr:type II toxin-antitoxin system VapC family toxin [Geodermatophilaceae bacterium]
MLVVDASVLVTALADDTEDGGTARARLAGESMSAPELIDLEIASVLRREHRAGRMPKRRADLALDDLSALPMRRVSHRWLLARCWELRDNMTPYDASYVALAEALDVVLLTADQRLTRASGSRCLIEVLTSQS